jgi:hypothetical protein
MFLRQKNECDIYGPKLFNKGPAYRLDKVSEGAKQRYLINYYF